jgi:hypothetical protein
MISNPRCVRTPHADRRKHMSGPSQVLPNSARRPELDINNASVPVPVFH